MKDISLESLLDIIVDSLNRMDERLTGHGERVAYGMLHLLRDDSRFSHDDVCKLTWLMLLHDIGNFQPSPIDDLIQRETDTTFSHGRYGYFFLKRFSPFPELAPIVLYHHTGRAEIEASTMDNRLQWVAKCLQVMDQVDLNHIQHPNASTEQLVRFLSCLSTTRFDSEAIAAVGRFLERVPMYTPACLQTVHNTLLDFLHQMEVTAAEKDLLLKLLVRSIDFRSHYTALHCSIVVRVSELLATACGLTKTEQQAVYLGALLHDLGKIAIPVSVLESPGKLEGQRWQIMQSHVTITEEILRGRVEDAVLQIAIRHHETLSGSGYPYGLSGDDLTLPQRIVAVADIVSALSEERSYKKSFPVDKVLTILESMCDQGKICPHVVAAFRVQKELIYQTVQYTMQAVEAEYNDIYRAYHAYDADGGTLQRVTSLVAGAAGVASFPSTNNASSG